jgi:2,4'-dihydroxyacetophenone dioxygenase
VSKEPDVVQPWVRELRIPVAAEIFVQDAQTDDERMWIPLGENVHSRPLCFNVSQGYWTHVMRVRRSGFINRHRHASPVHAVVLKGRWRYIEHDWTAEAGSYVYEPPGETHTLVVPEGVGEMQTFFHTSGVLLYVDAAGSVERYEDVFTRLELARRHFERVGLGANYVQRFVR